MILNRLILTLAAVSALVPAALSAGAVHIDGIVLEGRNADQSPNGDLWSTSRGTAQTYFFDGTSFLNPGNPGAIDFLLSSGANPFEFYASGSSVAAFYRLGILGNVDGAAFNLEALTVPGTPGSALIPVGSGVSTTVNGVRLTLDAFSLDQNTVADLVSFYGTTPNGIGDNVGRFTVSATPVPEPASLAALGLGTVAVLRRRRKA